MQTKLTLALASSAAFVIAIVVLTAQTVAGSDNGINIEISSKFLTTISQMGQDHPDVAATYADKAIVIENQVIGKVPVLQDLLNGAVTVSMNNLIEDPVYHAKVSSSQLDLLIQVLGKEKIYHESTENKFDYGLNKTVQISKWTALVEYNDAYYYLFITKLST